MKYFEAQLDVQTAPVQTFLRIFLEGVTLVDDLTVAIIKQAIRTHRLHLVSCIDVTDSIRSWAEFGVASSDLNSFFNELRRTVIDSATTAMSKSTREKVDKALSESITFESIGLLKGDLNELYHSLVDMVDNGVLMDEETLGTTREEINGWREAVMTRYTELKKSREEEESILKSQTEMYGRASNKKTPPNYTK